MIPKPPPSHEPTSRIDWNHRIVEDNELIRAYIAGVFDSGSSIRVYVRKDDSYGLGYKIMPSIEVRRQDEELPELLSYWAEQIGVRIMVEENDGQYRFTVNNRDDVKRILEEIQPYLLVYDDITQTILHEIIPRLEDGTHTTKDGFIETMEYVDSVRAAIPTKRSSKYDTEFFRDLWS